jgi:hypothetical protein
MIKGLCAPFSFGDIMNNVTSYADLPEQEQQSFRLWLSSILHTTSVTVTFLKSDGTERVMNCTLMEGVAIPHVKTTDRTKEPNDEVCPVWDIDKQAWRSFRYDSVTKVLFEASE